MATITEVLKGLFVRGGGSQGGVLKIGSGSVYNATAWEFSRISNSVYSNPTGYRCVEAIVSNFSRPAWSVTPKGADQPDPNHRLKRVLDRPMPGMSGTMMQRLIARDTQLTGKSFWTKVRGIDGFGNTGPITGFRRLAPQRVSVLGNQDDELIGFIYTDRTGTRQPALPRDVLYFRFPHPERDFDGLPPAMIAGLPAETDTAASRFNYTLLSNDGAMPGYIAVEGLTPAQFLEWKAAWEAGEIPGKTRFLGGSKASYIKTGQTNQELTYNELKRDSQDDMLRAFGVPRAVAFDVEETTYANADSEKQMFMQQNIAPQWILFGDEASVQLDDDEQVVIGFDVSEIDELQEAPNLIVERGIKLLDRQVITPNQLATDLGLPSHPWGDVPVQPVGAMIPQPGTPPVVAPSPKPGTGAPLLIAPDKKAAALTERHTAVASKSYDEFARRVSGLEERAQRKMARFYERQQKTVVAKLIGLKGKSVSKITAAGLEAPKWWDRQRWNDELSGELDDLLADVVDAFGTATADHLRSKFDPQAEAIRKYIQGRSTEVAGLVNGTTEEDLRATLSDAEATGQDVDGMVAAVQNYFTDRGPQRAEVFARTEVIGGANFASVSAARQSGVVTSKTWMTAADDAVEQDCADLDGETVGLDEFFSSGDDFPPLHPNCRCTVTYEVSEALPEAARLVISQQ